MSTEETPADTNEISNEDKLKIKLHLLFANFCLEIHRMASRFQHGNSVNFKVLWALYEECESFEEMVLEIRKYVEAMVFSEDVGEIEDLEWALQELPELYDGYYSSPTEGYVDIVRSFGLVNGYLKSMVTHECFSEIQNNASRGWPENLRIKDRSISDPAEFFYGYLQEIDASIAAVKLVIKRAEIRERERVHARNERVITKRKEEDLSKLQAIVAREQRDFGNLPKANSQ